MISTNVQAYIGTLHFGGSVLMITASEVEIVVCPSAPFVIRVPIANIVRPPDDKA